MRWKVWEGERDGEMKGGFSANLVASVGNLTAAASV